MTVPTVSDFVESAGLVGVTNAVIFLNGRAMLRSMRRKGQLRRAFHGWYVWMWMMGGVMIGGLFSPWATMSMYRGMPILTGFLAGWGGGMLNGWFALWRVGDPPPEVPKEE